MHLKYVQNHKIKIVLFDSVEHESNLYSDQHWIGEIEKICNFKNIRGLVIIIMYQNTFIYVSANKSDRNRSATLFWVVKTHYIEFFDTRV